MTNMMTILTDTERGAKGLVGFAGAAKAIWQEPSLSTIGAGLASGTHAASAVMKLAESVRSGFQGSGSGALPLALQIPKLAMGILPGATLAAAAPALAVAGVGLGLVNLGVGLFNAWQLRKARQEITAGFEQVQRTLQVQTTQLSILLTGVADLNHRLDILQHELQHGFVTVREEIRSLEAHRRADEFNEKINLLLQNQEELVLTLADGAQPHPNDLMRAANAGQALLAWVDAQLRNAPPGTPARLGLFVAKALALRVLADVAAFERGAPSRATSHRIERLVEEISAEVRAMVDGTTLYCVGVERADLIAQYIYLRRGLMTGLHHTAAASPAADWDDGLSALRSLFSAGVTSQRTAALPIGTLEDMAWYVEWAGLDARQSDLRHVKSVAVHDICARLGAPGAPSELSPDALATLLAIALPRYAQNSALALAREMGWGDAVPRFEGSQVSRNSTHQSATQIQITKDEKTIFHQLKKIYPKLFDSNNHNIPPKNYILCLNCGLLKVNKYREKCRCGRLYADNMTQIRCLVCLNCGHTRPKTQQNPCACDSVFFAHANDIIPLTNKEHREWILKN